jgi:ribosomal protein S18 acetylase RimI-like enzyme
MAVRHIVVLLAALGQDHPMSEVTHLNPSQSPKAAETLAQAFGDDPVYAYIFPNPDERLRSLRRLWQALITTCLRYGEVYATPTTNGVACWLPPGRTEMSLWRTLRTGLALPRAVMSFERNAQRRATTVFSTMDRVHAAAIQRPHWYLWVIGVHPASQGHGIGHSLLQPVLVKADAANLPCYLETQNESNVAFYRKRGFEVATVETPPDLGLTVWTMIREAR